MLYRLKNWLSKLFVKPPAMMSADATPETLEEGAAEVVTRARLGDQVAMAQMCLVREEAVKKNPNATRALGVLIDYVKKHPIESTSRFGDEMRRSNEADRLAGMMAATMGSEEDYPKAVVNLAPEIARNDLNKAIVTLANGPSLLARGEEETPVILAIANSLSSDQIRAAFALGVKHCEKALKSSKELPPECQAMVRLGYLLGTARKIQAVRIPQIPISALCSDAGWELGEGPDVQ